MWCAAGAARTGGGTVLALAREQGLVLEKAATLGGTTSKGGVLVLGAEQRADAEGWASSTREDGLLPLRSAAFPAGRLRSRSSDATECRQWEYASARRSTTTPRSHGAARARRARSISARPGVPDYWAELPRTRRRPGGCWSPRTRAHDVGRRRGGDRAPCRDAAERDGVDIRTGHRVQRVILDDKGRLIGVEADTQTARRCAFKARKAVIFATGGFTHDPDLRRNYLNVRCTAAARQ